MVTAVGSFHTEQNPAYRPTPALFFLDGVDRQMVERSLWTCAVATVQPMKTRVSL